MIKNELDKMQQYTTSFTQYVNELRARFGNRMLNEFAIMRRFPIEVVNEHDIFFIQDATEMLIPSYIDMVEDFGVISPTNKKPIFHNRWVIPIKNIDGNVINLVGYNKDADERYVYGTSVYYRRRETMFGLENLELAYELGYAILTEGITDTIRIRSLGYKNCFATCGTHKSDFIMKQLNRCRYGVIKIPDRDAPGQRALRGWTTYRSVILNTFIKYKDIDAMCYDSEENCNTVKEYIDASIEWLKTSEHRGYKSQSEVLTINI